MANDPKKTQAELPPAATPDKLDADGKKVEPVSPGDAPRAMENKASTGQGTTQEAADKAAAGDYRVLEPITYSGPNGHTTAQPGDIVTLTAEDAKGLLKAKAVESAETSGLERSTTADPRKIQ